MNTFSCFPHLFFHSFVLNFLFFFFRLTILSLCISAQMIKHGPHAQNPPACCCFLPLHQSTIIKNRKSSGTMNTVNMNMNTRREPSQQEKHKWSVKDLSGKVFCTILRRQRGVSLALLGKGVSVSLSLGRWCVQKYSHLLVLSKRRSCNIELVAFKSVDPHWIILLRGVK